MCSVLGILNLRSEPRSLRQRALQLSRRMRHRGPDWSGIYAGAGAILAHERLAIVGIDSGAQPIVNVAGTRVLAVNGEIYNHHALRAGFNAPYSFGTDSDCEVIIPLYDERGADFLNELEGMFAFVLFDSERGEALIARDPIGIIPLYTGHDEKGQLYVASELKALVDTCQDVQEFPPGHYQWSRGEEPVRYYSPPWRSYEVVESQPASAESIRDALEKSVERHLMCDVPHGVLLSGGLDSSVIAALAHKIYRRRVEDDAESPAWWPQLHSFAIGLEGSPDLAAAKKVAEHLGSIHHGFEYTVSDGLDALSDVIYHLETYDVTTIRASTPMYLLARKIKAMGIKMVLSGEGADEIFGGYLYFHKSPDARAFHEETIRKLDRLHLFDCLRANKSMAAWGVEARVPFLDRRFLDVAMSIQPEAKRPASGRIEKHILREAFQGYLPEEILWRQKEQFSDGVGYAWIDSLREFAEQSVDDSELEAAKFKFPINTPETKEAYLYRKLFSQHFPSNAAARCVPGGKSAACSTPEALAWDLSLQTQPDPSGRTISVHTQTIRSDSRPHSS